MSLPCKEVRRGRTISTDLQGNEPSRIMADIHKYIWVI